MRSRRSVRFGILESIPCLLDKAARPRPDGEVLLTTIERRLDNVVYRLGLPDPPRGRQLSPTATLTSTACWVNSPLTW
jgi:hypothetical protein